MKRSKSHIGFCVLVAILLSPTLLAIPPIPLNPTSQFVERMPIEYLILSEIMPLLLFIRTPNSIIWHTVKVGLEREPSTIHTSSKIS